MSSVYFNPETQELNEAGRRKLFAIVQSAPQEFQTIYVVRSMDSAAQERRIASIQEASSQLFTNQAPPQIQTVGVAPRSWSGEYVNTITTQRNDSIPKPRLPDFTSTTNGP